MSKVKLIAVGDNLIHDRVYNTCRGEDGSYNFDGLYEPVKGLIQSADISVVNQETVFGGDSTKYSSFPFFCTPPEAGDALVKAGFTVVTSATNHVMDKGGAGLNYTLDYWASKHPEITLLGIRKTKKHRCLIKKNGIKLAMFNFTRGLNYHPRPFGAPYMVDMLKPKYKSKIRRRLLKARELADIVVVFPHWGIEYDHAVCENQKMWTRLFAECGVDIVIGTHPHVIQPFVKVKRPDDVNMYVFYSIGNFISGQKRIPELIGGMADITIVKEGLKARVDECKLRPLITHVGPDESSYAVYPLEDYPDELGEANHIGKVKGFDTRGSNLHDFYEKILRGEVAGNTQSQVKKIKVAIRHLVKKK